MNAAPRPARGAAPARMAALALAASVLAPFPAAATTVKHLERWVLGFPKGSAELGPPQRRDLVALGVSIERHCTPGPVGGALLAIETVEPRRGLDEAGQSLALERRRNVKSLLERLAPPATLMVEGVMPDREWRSRADTAGVPMRRPSSDEVLLELACDPRS